VSSSRRAMGQMVAQRQIIYETACSPLNKTIEPSSG
jgi:hypothetical protein